MSVRITARCASCARKFVARDGATGYVSCEDVRGVLTCDKCVCDYCGRGHAVAEQFDECDQDRADDVFEYLYTPDSAETLAVQRALDLLPLAV